VIQFTKDELDMLYDIVSHHAYQRYAFSNAIAQKSFRKRDGSEASTEDIHDAFQKEKIAEGLVEKISIMREET